MHELIAMVKIHRNVALDALDQGMRAALTSPLNWLHGLGERAAIMVMVFLCCRLVFCACCVLRAAVVRPAGSSLFLCELSGNRPLHFFLALQS